MIERVHLLNIKSFKNASIPLGRFTLVVGSNAAGKSNLRDGLRFLHGMGLGYSIAEVLGDKYGAGGVLQWRGVRGGLEEFPFTEGGEGRAGWGTDVRISGWDSHPALTWVLKILGGTRASGPTVNWESINDDADKVVVFLDRGRARPGREHRDYNDGPEKGRLRSMLDHAPIDLPEPERAIAAHFADSIKSMRFLDLDPEAMRQPSIPGQDILGDRGENLSSVLLAISEDPARKEVLLSWVRALTPMDATDLEFVATFGGKVLLHLVESGGRKTSALSASDGTLRFLALVAALLSPETGRFFFFEELDNGIHPTRLPLLLDLIERTCREQHIQVVATTHNPALLGFLNELARNDALIVYRPEGAPDSRVRRVGELPGIDDVLKLRDLGALHLSGWLENAAQMCEPEP